MRQFWNNEDGFILSAELILISTIVTLALVVGLSEISLNINNELEDVASAFGRVSQTYTANGLSSHAGRTNGSSFTDSADFCDEACNVASVRNTFGE